MKTARRLQLRTTSDPANLAPVRHDVEAFCESCGMAEKARNDVGLCVNEALANITRHAYRGAADQPVHLDAEFHNGVLTLTIRDWGSGEYPEGCGPRKDPLQPGGVGLVCLRCLMDNVTFTPQPDGMLLRMERRL